MNPHFLFNTLQLISWKAYEYEAYPVCDMISSLSYMLQTDLYSNENKSILFVMKWNILNNIR